MMLARKRKQMSSLQLFIICYLSTFFFDFFFLLYFSWRSYTIAVKTVLNLHLN